MTDINQLHQQLVRAMHELAEAEAADDPVVRLYDATLDRYVEKFKEEHADLVQRSKATAARREEAATLVKTLRSQVQTAITGAKIWVLPEGFNQTRNRQIQYDPDELLKAALHHAPFLLVIDDKRLEKFIGQVVEDQTTHFTLPDYLKAWLPVTITTGYKASISDATLKKLPLPEPLMTDVMLNEDPHLEESLDLRDEEAARIQEYDVARYAREPIVREPEDIGTGITAYITLLERGETRNSKSAKWDCTTVNPVPKGLRIFHHEDPEKDNFRLFIDAGYSEFMKDMRVGDFLSWVGDPIEVQITENADGWWNIVAVTPRPTDVYPSGYATKLKVVPDSAEVDGAALEKLKAQTAVGILGEDDTEADFDTHRPIALARDMDDVPF